MKFTSKKTQQLIRIGLLHKYLTPFDLYLFSVQQYLHSPAHGSLHIQSETCIPQQLGGYRIKSTKVKRPAVQYIPSRIGYLTRR